MPPYKQDLSKAAGGKITGRGGNTQQLGAAAQKRLAGGVGAAAKAPVSQPATPPPAWQQLRQQGIAGQGSAGANRAALAGLQPQLGFGAPPPMAKPNFPPPSDMGDGGVSDAMYRIPRGMASFLRPPMEGGPGMDGPAMNGSQLPEQMDVPGGGMPGAPPAGPLGAAVNRLAGPGGMPPPAPPPGMAKPNFGGVDSNAFAAQGGTPSGPAMQPGGGQAGRIAALMARINASRQPQLQAA